MRRGLPLLVWLLAANPAAAQNSVVVFTESTLNRLVERLRNPSDSGLFTPTAVSTVGGFEQCEFFGYLDCPGEPLGGRSGDRLPLARCRTAGGIRIVASGAPISWAWWVTDARFDVAPGKMSFTATVRYRVGKAWGTKSKTVGAALGFDPATNRLRISVEDFKVPLEHTFQGASRRVTEVDVAKLYGLSVGIAPQRLNVPLPNGTSRTVTAKATGVTTQYEVKRIRVNVDVGFN
jgi:hypothetical protein